MAFDRAVADEEPPGDLGRGEALGGEAGHFQLPGRERRDPEGGVGRPPPGPAKALEVGQGPVAPPGRPDVGEEGRRLLEDGHGARLVPRLEGPGRRHQRPAEETLVAERAQPVSGRPGRFGGRRPVAPGQDRPGGGQVGQRPVQVPVGAAGDRRQPLRRSRGRVHLSRLGRHLGQVQEDR